jgi:hypothetical protein
MLVSARENEAGLQRGAQRARAPHQTNIATPAGVRTARRHPGSHQGGFQGTGHSEQQQGARQTRPRPCLFLPSAEARPSKSVVLCPPPNTPGRVMLPRPSLPAHAPLLWHVLVAICVPHAVLLHLAWLKTVLGLPSMRWAGREKTISECSGCDSMENPPLTAYSWLQIIHTWSQERGHDAWQSQFHRRDYEH